MPKKIAPRKKTEPLKKPSRPPEDSFLSSFDEKLFIPALKAKTKIEVLEDLVDALVCVIGPNSRGTLLSMIQHRELLGSTGIGKGIAVPHGRTLLTRRLHVVVGRSEKGIEFEALDEKPVHLFFLIVAPFQDPGNRYLTTLGRLVELVKHKKNRDKLLAAADFEGFKRALTPEE